MMGYPTIPARKKGPASARNERVDDLLGERRGAEGGSGRAVTVKDAATMGQVQLKSARVSASPTMEQHNALVEDLRTIAAILNRMGATITGL